MRRAGINRIAAVTPLVMSLMACAIVLVAVTTGWQRRATDEGTAAHLFQLLIVLQVPVIIVFLITARWGFGTIVKPLALQAAALGLAFGLVAYFRL